MHDRHLRILGWVATATAVAMYLSYIDQIQLNLAGEKGSLIQPLATMVNCSLWVAYGSLRRPRRDWPIVLANAPGVLLGAISFATAL
ncbi:SWEET family sugar transporter [Sphingomonas sp. RHCKR47]|uniref:SWEET family sugar transporter n=1 Tax=Sphingomonas citricola TaxID=2862498 RepID=UPI001CA59EDF|nr:SWEET family sugar transporter [Sphingomonas citricola]MBW6523033.1 SWEET family sugar transporter [Sphingomonas citricola]